MIFVSHSNKDRQLIEEFRKSLEPHGITLLIAEHLHDLQHTTTEKIESMIDSCDIALILLTENGFEAPFVQQEIGYLKKAGKPFLQVVQKGLEDKISGFNYGRDYIEFDPSNTDAAVKAVQYALLKHWETQKQKDLQLVAEIEKRRALEKQMVEDRQKIFGALTALALMIILVALLSSEG